MDGVFSSDPWAAAARSLKPRNVQVPALMFAAPTKQAMAIVEEMLGVQVLGLGDAAAKLSKLEIPDHAKNVLNKTTKMLRILNEANNLERHFTDRGISGWLEKLDCNIQELRMGGTQPYSLSREKGAAALAPPAPVHTQVNEMMDQLKAGFMDGIAGQRCHFQNKLNETADLLPSMIDAHIQPLKDMIVNQGSRLTALEAAAKDLHAGAGQETEKEIAEMIDKVFVEKFMETFPLVFNVAIRKSDEGMATLTEEFEKIAAEVKRVSDRLDSIFHPGISIAVDNNEPPLTDEELAAAGLYGDFGSDHYNGDYGSDDYNNGGPGD